MRYRFGASKMNRHFITRASANSASALSMAKEVHVALLSVCMKDADSKALDGIQDLVQMIDRASIMLIQRCESVAWEIEERRKAEEDGNQG